MSVPITFFGYFLFMALQTIFLILGVIHIIKYPTKLKLYQEKYLYFGVILCYVLNVMEKLVHNGSSSPWFYDMIPIGNLSPFLFTLTIIALFLPEKFQKYYRAVIGIMCVGMTCAGYYNSITRLFSFNPWLYTCIVFDNFGHILIGLYGFYIIRNHIITYDKLTKLWTCGFVFGVALLMLILNAIFHTSFFGLNLYGEHNIYHLVLTKSSILSAIIYFIGLSVVLAGGWILASFIQKHPKLQLEKEEDAK